MQLVLVHKASMPDTRVGCSTHIIQAPNNCWQACMYTRPTAKRLSCSSSTHVLHPSAGPRAAPAVRSSKADPPNKANQRARGLGRCRERLNRQHDLHPPNAPSRDQRPSSDRHLQAGVSSSPQTIRVRQAPLAAARRLLGHRTSTPPPTWTTPATKT
jgi:hypothetical protein